MLEEMQNAITEKHRVIAQVEAMLALQDKMNTRVHEHWRTQGFEWYRAIWTECAETMDHFGWKWWKKQTPDSAQVCMELVDIWHFGLSIVLVEGLSAEQVVEALAGTAAEHDDFRLALEDFTAATLTTRGFDLPGFKRLMMAMEMSNDDLYAQYIGKNVLNFFRQDHGYQTGEYKKIWGGKEDNEHLVEVLKTLDPSAEDFSDQLYVALEARYPT